MAAFPLRSAAKQERAFTTLIQHYTGDLARQVTRTIKNWKGGRSKAIWICKWYNHPCKNPMKSVKILPISEFSKVIGIDQYANIYYIFIH